MISRYAKKAGQIIRYLINPSSARCSENYSEYNPKLPQAIRATFEEARIAHDKNAATARDDPALGGEFSILHVQLEDILKK